MNTDSDIQRDVMDELTWEPSIDATAIGVAVESGVVTLSGQVSNLVQKWEAEQAAKRVRGVQAVANEITVHMPDGIKTDTDIARTALNWLEWDAVVPDKRMTVTVSDGWITLEGVVERHYQKAAAERVVRHLAGVKGITNRITVTPLATPQEVKMLIEQALKRSAMADAQQIIVQTRGHTILLHGHVRTWAEHEDVLHAAWAAPGVSTVEDYLRVGN